MAAIAYLILERAIVAKEGRDSFVARAIGPDWKGKLSAVLYFAAIPTRFCESMDCRRTICVRRAPLVGS